MIDDRYIELMNGEIDGMNSPEQSRDLKEYLRTHPEAQSHFDQLRALENVFEEAKRITPPREMRENVLSLLFDGKQGEESKRISFFVRSFFKEQPKRRLLYVFGTGLITGVLLFSLIALFVPPGDELDFGKLYGTLTLMKNEKALFISEPISFNVSGVSGFVRVRYAMEKIFVELKLVSRSQARVTIQHNPRVRFEGLSVSGEAEHRTEITKVETMLIHSGDREYLFLFSDDDRTRSSITIKVLGENGQFFEKKIQPEQS